MCESGGCFRLFQRLLSSLLVNSVAAPELLGRDATAWMIRSSCFIQSIHIDSRPAEESAVV